MQPSFTISTEHVQDTAVVVLAGDLDSTTSPRLREVLATEMSAGRVHLVLDVAALAFCDSMGLRVLLDFLRQSGAVGGELRLAGVNGALERLLHITGLSALFPADADTAAAVAACGTSGTQTPG